MSDRLRSNNHPGVIVAIVERRPERQREARDRASFVRGVAVGYGAASPGQVRLRYDQGVTMIERLPHTKPLRAQRRRHTRRRVLLQGSQPAPRPLIAASDQPSAQFELRRALATIDRVVNTYADNAPLAPTM
jgi:hypothetical protein